MSKAHQPFILTGLCSTSCPPNSTPRSSKLTGRGVLTEDAVKEGLREIRRILLEADVSFDLTREFLERVQDKAVGASVLKEVRPGQQIVKIVYDELVACWARSRRRIAHATVPPTVILLVGLQGSGKTTTAGKLAKRLKLEQKAPFLVAADVYRPAADRAAARRWASRWTSASTATPASKDVVKIVRDGIDGGRQGAGPDGAGGHRGPAADRRRDDGRAQAAQGRGAARTRSCSSPTA